jgi:hypothetical protein
MIVSAVFVENSLLHLQISKSGKLFPEILIALSDAA